jgi:hypothetical protein
MERTIAVISVGGVAVCGALFLDRICGQIPTEDSPGRLVSMCLRKNTDATKTSRDACTQTVDIGSSLETSAKPALAAKFEVQRKMARQRAEAKRAGKAAEAPVEVPAATSQLNPAGESSGEGAQQSIKAGGEEGPRRAFYASHLDREPTQAQRVNSGVPRDTSLQRPSTAVQKIDENMRKRRTYDNDEKMKTRILEIKLVLTQAKAMICHFVPRNAAQIRLLRESHNELNILCMKRLVLAPEDVRMTVVSLRRGAPL